MLFIYAHLHHGALHAMYVYVELNHGGREEFFFWKCPMLKLDARKPLLDAFRSDTSSLCRTSVSVLDLYFCYKDPKILLDSPEEHLCFSSSWYGMDWSKAGKEGWKTNLESLQEHNFWENPWRNMSFLILFLNREMYFFFLFLTWGLFSFSALKKLGFFPTPAFLPRRRSNFIFCVEEW